jgi:luciferase family oxidoreductase group 1
VSGSADAPRVPLSILDLAPIREGGTPREALQQTLELARAAERAGFNRYWLAEHHNMPGIASSATAILIGQVAAVTERIRVGSGGIMLPNHAPLVVAEQFGTLGELFPGRIDLGLGRAPGTDHVTGWALRRNPNGGVEFPAEVDELRGFLAPASPGQRVRAVPGAGADVPVWLLGSSTFSAELAAREGLPFAFASHFAPAMLMEAIAIYRARFQPSEQLSEPYVMVGANVMVADTDEEAQRLFTSTLQKFVSFLRAAPAGTQPPLDDISSFYRPGEQAAVESQMREAIVGSPSTVRAGLEDLVARTGANEIIAAGDTYDFAPRVRSYELLAQLWGLDGSRDTGGADAGAAGGAARTAPA